jgi:multidrug efflux pump subunit AcrB
LLSEPEQSRGRTPSPPTYKKVSPADTPILIITAQSNTMPLIEVNDNVDAKLAPVLILGFWVLGGED